MRFFQYLLVFIICGASFSAMGQDENSNKVEQRFPGLEWRYMYFSGITKGPVNEINLSTNLVKSLLSMVGAKSAISTGAAVEPRYILNSKGLTVWLALNLGIFTSQPEALGKIHAGEMAINMPASYLNEIFGEHINWPERMIKKYDLSLGEDTLFIIPFLVPKNGSKLKQLPRSMQAPDGSLEIMALHEFNHDNPETMLAQLAGLVKYIKENKSSLAKANN